MKKYIKIASFLCAASSTVVLGINPLEEALYPFLPKVLGQVVTSYLPLADRLANLEPTITPLSEAETEKHPIKIRYVSIANHEVFRELYFEEKPSPKQAELKNFNEYCIYTNDNQRITCLASLDDDSLLTAHCTAVKNTWRIQPSYSYTNELCIWNLAADEPTKVKTIPIVINQKGNWVVSKFKIEPDGSIIILATAIDQPRADNPFLQDDSSWVRRYPQSTILKLTLGAPAPNQASPISAAMQQPATLQPTQPSSFKNFLTTLRWPFFAIGTIAAGMAAYVYWWRK